MKFQVMSDLHLEFCGYNREVIIPADVDVVILAGDVGTKVDRTMAWIKNWMQDKQVVMVAGNHEYYGDKLQKTDFEFKEYDVKYDWFHFLQDGYYTEVLGQGFAGGTLWTDFKKFDPLIQAHCGLTMRDYDVIRAPPNYRRLQPADTYLIHQDTVKHLDDVLYAHPETIVVTHTAPHALCVHDKYKDDWMTNHAYYTDLDWMLEKYDIPFWFHGHMHDTHDITVHNTRIICNPYGYDGHEVNPLFNPNLILEI